MPIPITDRQERMYLLAGVVAVSFSVLVAVGLIGAVVRWVLS